MKIKWKVGDKPTGRFSCFEHRGWPTAYYSNGDPAVMLVCEDPYVPSRIKVGNHAPINSYLANYGCDHAEHGAFKWVKVSKQFTTLKEAKAESLRLLETRDQFWPAGISTTNKGEMP